MSSSQGSTQQTTAAAPVTEDQEPLLGRPGDLAQREGTGLFYNWIAGTAPLAQAGGLMLVAVIWGVVFTHDILIPFSLHPLLNSVAILFVVEAILVLQPTHTADQKRKGTYAHASLAALAALCFYGAIASVLVHKTKAGLPHYESPHAILGAVIYTLLFIQALVGFTQYFVPALYGGVGNAKSVYKYHRVSGYVILFLLLTNVVLASLIFYGDKILGLKTWGLVLICLLTIAGVYPRIKKQKVKLF